MPYVSRIYSYTKQCSSPSIMNLVFQLKPMNLVPVLCEHSREKKNSLIKFSEQHFQGCFWVPAGNSSWATVVWLMWSLRTYWQKKTEDIQLKGTLSAKIFYCNCSSPFPLVLPARDWSCGIHSNSHVQCCPWWDRTEDKSSVPTKAPHVHPTCHSSAPVVLPQSSVQLEIILQGSSFCIHQN